MPLTDTIKDTIRAHLRALHGQPGFRPRRSQNILLAEIARTLGGECHPTRRILVAEAKTGTGKSLAYLIPALAIAEAEGKTVILSTAIGHIEISDGEELQIRLLAR